MIHSRTSASTHPDTLSLSITPGIHLNITWTASGISSTSFFTHTTTLPEFIPSRLPNFLTKTLALLDSYFQGMRTDFSRIPLDPPYGTTFQHAVWHACHTIPWGQTRSYAWLAARIQKPTAARAVGNALARNPLPVLVPCHRVIRADGALGGFGLGPHFKRTLLNLENPPTTHNTH